MIKELIEKIKQKKELSGLPASLVEEELEKCILSSNINTSELKMAEAKSLIKKVRARLRLMSGRFTVSLKKRLNLVKNNKIEDLLKTNSSTNERIYFYPELVKIIHDLGIKKILDLGCGLNPIALANRNMKYFAADINNQDLEVVNYFFKNNNIDGETFFYDLRKIKDDLPSVDLCILFKVLDLIENKGHKKTEEILKKVKSKYFLISFSTKTLSGRKMNHPQRGWIEKLLSRLCFSFNTVKTKNEIFYLANART